METLTDTSLVRVWIYRSVQKLAPDQEEEINRAGNEFINQWAAHGTKLHAEFKILYHHFLVFFVDQVFAQASGCSIDSSVAFIRRLETKYQLGLLDRMQTGFLKNGEVEFYHFNELKNLLEKKVITGNDTICNQLVQTKAEFDKGFLIKFSDSNLYRSLR